MNIRHLTIIALIVLMMPQPFGKICDLVSISESVVKLTAICALCYAPASFSKRIVDDDRIELIGSSDMYIPCCRAVRGVFYLLLSTLPHRHYPINTTPSPPLPLYDLTH